MNNKELIDELRKAFHKRLQTKTNWGRNQIILEFERAVIEVLMNKPKEIKEELDSKSAWDNYVKNNPNLLD